MIPWASHQGKAYADPVRRPEGRIPNPTMYAQSPGEPHIAARCGLMLLLATHLDAIHVDSCQRSSSFVLYKQEHPFLLPPVLRQTCFETLVEEVTRDTRDDLMPYPPNHHPVPH